MKCLVYLVAVLSTVALFTTGQEMVGKEVGNIFDLDRFPQLRDEHDLRAYTKMELDAIEYIKAYNQSRSFLATLVPPSCDFSEWMYPSCCVTLEILDHPHEICLDMALQWRDLTLSLALNHNGEVLFSFDFVLGEVCVGMPYFNKLGVCGHLYHIDFKRTPNLFMRACLTVKIKAIVDLIEVRFYCLDAKRTSATVGILSQTWELSRNDRIDPPTSAVFAVLIKTDKVAMEFNSPIPPQLVEMMKQYWKGAVELINKSIMVVKNTIVKTWNTIANAATSVWNWCKNIFG